MIFAFDLDGTFLNTKHEVSKVNAQLIKDLNANGHTTIIATGRHSLEIDVVTDSAPFQYIISSNGAWIYDVRKDHWVQKINLTVEQGLEFIEVGSKHMDCLVIHNNPPLHLKVRPTDVDYAFQWFERYEAFDGNYEEITSKLTEVVQFAGYNLLDPTLKELRNAFNNSKTLKEIDILPVYMKNGDVWVDMPKKGINKAFGITNLLDYLNLEGEIYCFGDSTNDYKMFEKYHGLAMDNGNPLLKGIAKEVIGDNDSNSINNWIRNKVNI